jgi:hypothetical protein
MTSPNSDPNAINTRSHGVIPVAILTTDEFDAAEVDVERLLQGRRTGLNGDCTERTEGRVHDVAGRTMTSSSLRDPRRASNPATRSTSPDRPSAASSSSGVTRS